jgi:hypothetical protein
MNSVKSINEHSFPRIDVKKIIQTIRDISRLANFRHERSDVLQERAQRVVAYLNNLDKNMREAFPVLLTALNGASGQAWFSALEELHGALASNDLTAQDRDLINEEVSNIKGNIEAMLERVEAKFTDHALLLEGQVRSLYKIEIDERTDEPYKVAKAHKARILDQLNEQTLIRALCVEKRDILVNAQNVIREFNLAERYKSYIPQGKALDGLDMENPKKEALRQGLELVRKVLGVVSIGIKYVELANSRNSLDMEIQSISLSMDGLNDQLKAAEDALSDVSAVIDISRQRRVVGDEIISVVGIWAGFSVALGRLKKTDYAPAHLFVLLNRYKAHLQTLSDDYNGIMIN